MVGPGDVPTTGAAGLGKKIDLTVDLHPGTTIYTKMRIAWNRHGLVCGGSQYRVCRRGGVI